MIKAIRGATTIEVNNPENIHQRTNELMEAILRINNLSTSEIISIIFSVTQDITAANPATVFRKNFSSDIPLFCVQEAHFKGSLSHCIRVMIHCQRDEEVKHCYLHKAKLLRPDMVN